MQKSSIPCQKKMTDKTTLDGDPGTGTLSFKVHNCQEDPSLWQFKVLKRIKTKQRTSESLFF